MYLRQVTLINIKGLERVDLDFAQYMGQLGGSGAGWHVLIGENGSGKSTIVKAIAAGLIGKDEIAYTQQKWNTWLRKGHHEGKIVLVLGRNEEVDEDRREDDDGSPYATQEFWLSLKAFNGSRVMPMHLENPAIEFSRASGWFSVGYGSFRRLSGGSAAWDDVYESYPRAAAHLSVFAEDATLNDATQWLKDLDYQRLKKGEENTLMEHLKAVINTSGLLPNAVRFQELSAEGDFIFVDGNGATVMADDLSDGYRSMLSLILDLIYRLVKCYGEDRVFTNETSLPIELPGVVLIDEVDTHLHPSWQTQIGTWFTKVFPNIQFIVTTHSPLICRAADPGTIWQLPRPGSGEPMKQITGVAKERLLYGTILDAFGTEVFGKEANQSKKGKEELKTLNALYKKSFKGTITPEEREQFNQLRAKMPTAL